MDTTEHFYEVDLTQGRNKNIVNEHGFVMLKEKGELITGTPYYENSGEYEGNPIEIGDLFKEFSPMDFILPLHADPGFHQPEKTDVTVEQLENSFKVGGYMIANDTSRVLTHPFSTDYDRYFEYKMAQSNRYIAMCIVADGTTVLGSFTYYYLVNYPVYVGTLIGFHIRWADKKFDMYINGEFKYSQNLYLTGAKNYRVMLVSRSSTTHIGEFYIYRNQFNYPPPAGAFGINDSIDGKPFEILTSTSLLGDEWSPYVPLDGRKVQSPVGRFIRMKIQMDAITDELTYKEYDFVARDETPRVATAHNIADTSFMEATSEITVAATANEGQTVFRINLQRSKMDRIDAVNILRTK